MWRHGSIGSQIRGHSRQSGTTAGPPRYYRKYCSTTVPPEAETLFNIPALFTLFSGLLHLICFCVFVSVCFGVWSGDGSRSHLKRNALVTGKATSSSMKRTTHKEKEKEKPLFELPLPEYRDYRRVNPYKKPRDPSLFKTKLWNKK